MTVSNGTWRRVLLAASAIALAVSAAAAQTTVKIWPGVAPGSEHWTQHERTFTNTPVGTVIQNVVTPTLTAYLPPKDKATGAGIIIAPGGAFVALAIDLEANQLARVLQQRGVAAFVLKYRTVEKKVDGIPNMDMDTAGRYGIADGIQALKVVRAHAAEWNVSPHRVGMIGFSAGGMVTTGALLQPAAAARPDFAALIYGAPFGKMPAIPAKLPPIFMAWAHDDPVALKPVVGFRDALLKAGIRPDVHEYDKGGHGFGMKTQGTSSDRWVEDFWRWLLPLTRQAKQDAVIPSGAHGPHLSFRASAASRGIRTSAPNRGRSAWPNDGARISNGDLAENAGSTALQVELLARAQGSAPSATSKSLMIRSEISPQTRTNPACSVRSGSYPRSVVGRVQIPRLASLARNDSVGLRSLGMTG